jgi:protein phosphatase 1 regulatory subunit 37
MHRLTFMQSPRMQFLDLSQNALDKRAVEHVAAALAHAAAPEPGLESLKLDDCALKPAALEALGPSIRLREVYGAD